MEYKVKITVNHVMSNNVKSNIFDDFLGYFKKHGEIRFDYVSSPQALNGALIRHYHRPNLEQKLVNPCLVTVHHDLSDNDDWLAINRFIDRYREADLVVCLNSKQKEILEGYGLDNLLIIPHGYNPQYLEQKKKKVSVNRRIVLGFFSRRYGRKVKGEDYLYELVKRLNPDDFSFVLAGKDRSIDAKYLSRLGFDVEFYENLKYELFCGLYNKIDFLLVASKYEGGPASLPEAVFTGTPILTTPVGMGVDLVDNLENGVFLSGSPEKDARIFEDLSLLDGYADKLMVGAWQRRKRVIPWGEVVHEYESAYLRLIDGVMV